MIELRLARPKREDRFALNGSVVVLGPNGAGKSTFLSKIHGINPSPNDQVFWGDKPASMSKANRGFVSQIPHLFDGTVLDNLHFARRAFNIPKKEFFEEVNIIADQFELADLLERHVYGLSGGEQARVNIMRSLIGKPPILLLDEPTAHLDPRNTAIIERVIKNFSKQAGRLILFVSHDIAQAKRIADQVIFIHQGEILQYGSAKELLGKGAKKEVKLFMSGELLCD